MVTRISIVAGEILNLLEEFNRTFHVEEIEFYIDEPYELIFMSLGWLARQGLIHMKQEDSDEFVVMLPTDSNALRSEDRKARHHLRF